MLITVFLSQTDELASSMDKEQLLAFIHNETRILPESECEAFLQRMNSFKNPAAQKASSVIHLLSAIRAGNVPLSSS